MSDDASNGGERAKLMAKAKSAHVVDFLNHTLKEALAVESERIEIVIQAAQSSIRFERGGLWNARPASDRELTIGLAARLKILANVDPAGAGDGSFQLKVRGKSYGFKLKAGSGVAGEILTVHISQMP